MTRIDPVEFQGPEDRAAAVPQGGAARARQPRPAAPRARPASAASLDGRQGRQAEAGLHLQHLRPRGVPTGRSTSQAISYTTGVPAMIGAMMMLTGKWQSRASGTWSSSIRTRSWRRWRRWGCRRWWLTAGVAGALVAMRLPSRHRPRSLLDVALLRLAVFLRSPRRISSVCRIMTFRAVPGWILTGIDIDKILQLAPSPAYVVDLGRLRANLAILDEVQKRSGAKILLALKGFAMWSVFPHHPGDPPRCLRQLPVGGAPGARGVRPGGAQLFAAACATPMSLNCLRSPTTWSSTPSTRWSGSGPSGSKERGGFHRPARQSRAFGGTYRDLRSLRAQVAPRHSARRVRGTVAGRGRGAALPHPLRAALRAAGADARGVRGEVRRVSAGDELAQPRRRPPHYPRGLRSRWPGRAGAVLPREVRSGGLPGAG